MNQISAFKQNLVISATFLIALVLTTVPLPGLMIWFRPAWVMITLLFWLIAVPHRLGIFVSWFLGFLVDLLTGGLIGVQALLFTLLAFFVLKFHPFVRGLSVLHKFIFVALMQTLILIVQSIVLSVQGGLQAGWLYWMPILSTPFLWVLVKLVLRELQLRYKIG